MGNFEKFDPSGVDIYYIVADRNGTVFYSTQNYSTAWTMAKSVDGWLGETVWSKPVDLKEVAGPELGAEIESFLENPTGGVRRGRPTHKETSTAESGHPNNDSAAVGPDADSDAAIDNNQ